MSRTPDDLEQIVSTATQRDLLYLEQETGVKGDDIDRFTHILVAYLIDKKETGSSSIGKWLDTPLTEVAAFIDIDEDAVSDPKEGMPTGTDETSTSPAKPNSVSN